MDNVIKKAWEAKRNKVVERFVGAWEIYDGASKGDPEGVNIAIDAVAVAHVAAALEWDGNSRKQWADQEGKAMERVVVAWTKYDPTEENPEVEEELNIALDALAVAHIAATFEWASGPLKW